MAGAIVLAGVVPALDFPSQDYEKIAHLLVSRASDVAHSHFVSAWSALPNRHLALTKCDDSFTTSLATDGAGPAFPKRYEQERDLFGFASSAFSAFECFHYAMFAIGTCLKPSSFPLAKPSDERNVSFDSTRKAYSSAFPGDAILNWFARYKTNVHATDIIVLRNFLTHRGIPPRHHWVGGPNHGTAVMGRVGLKIDGILTSSLRVGVSPLLSDGLSTLLDFIQRSGSTASTDNN